MSISSSARVYLERAEAFYRSAELLGDDPPDPLYAPAVGLLAVHSSISMTDAVLTQFDNGRSKSEDHNTAATALEKLCSVKKRDRSGVKHLKGLIGNKTRFSYGDAVVRDEEFQKARLKMERFFKWAYGTFPEIAQTEEASDAQSV